jgi:hypothetical protein
MTGFADKKSPVMNTQRIPWQGNAAIKTGVGIFRGTVGDSHFHTHWATQITIALNGECILETPRTTHRCSVFIIKAGTQHRLQYGHVVSIYIDPASNFIDSLFKQAPAQDDVVLLSRADLHPSLLEISADTNLQTVIRNIQQATEQQRSGDPRLAQIISQLQSQEAETALTREQLAAALGLSSSRFSHWFKEQTGMPLRSYKKWLKLRLAIERCFRRRGGANWRL